MDWWKPGRKQEKIIVYLIFFLYTVSSGYSQGGLIARGIIQTFPNVSVSTFISLSSPQAGQYGGKIIINYYLIQQTLLLPYSFWYTNNTSFQGDNYIDNQISTKSVQPFSNYKYGVTNGLCLMARYVLTVVFLGIFFYSWIFHKYLLPYSCQKQILWKQMFLSCR